MNKLIFTILYCFLAFNSNAQTERKFQIWNKNNVVIQPWKNIFIDVAEKIHYSPERNAADIKFAELFLSHGPLKWFEYGAGFRVAKANLYPGWFQENRTMIIANFTKEHNQFSFKYSNRFEYRAFQNNLHHFRYRQEFKVEFPSLTNWGMRFYTSEETYFKLNDIGFHTARIYGGLSVVQKEHVKLKTYYALEKYKLFKNWATSDIVGLNMSFMF
jgi:hypothetical protein